MTALLVRYELGSTDGLRVAVKGSVDVEDVPAQFGSATCEVVAPATVHAEMANLTLNAGYQIIGKTLMHELAFGITGINHYSGTPVNTHYPDLIPGGTSCGSAVAVAEDADEKVFLAALELVQRSASPNNNKYTQ